MLAELRAEARKPIARGVQCADSVYLSSLIVRTELTVGPPPSECRHPLYWRASGAWGACLQSSSFGMCRSRRSVCHALQKWEIKARISRLHPHVFAGRGWDDTGNDHRPDRRGHPQHENCHQECGDGCDHNRHNQCSGYLQCTEPAAGNL